MKKSYIYTKGGDKGKTSLIGGTRVSKSEKQLEAYGTVDELNANIGLLVSLLQNEEDKHYLVTIQHQLFTLGAYLATDFQKENAINEAHDIALEEIEKLEAIIDEIDAQLPSLKSFIIPGGSTASASAHLCRTVCRRAERIIVALAQELPLSENILAYLNRLSDYFFVLSRKLNIDHNFQEQLWHNNWK